MLAGLELLKQDPRMQEILSAYAALKKKSPNAEWHDRIMEWNGCTAEQINKLHGLLLANGWLETRIHGDAFKTAGRLEACYRITTDGAAMLKLAAASHPIIPEDDDSDEIAM